jgi:SAM-dependent methyltransferase
MLGRARAAVPAPSVEFLAVPGDGLDPVESGIADALVCYLVLQHLPQRRTVMRYLREFGRVLAPKGSAFVQVPVLGGGVRPLAWRLARDIVVPVASRLGGNVESKASYRGTRLTESELRAGIDRAGLRVAARDESPVSPYRYAREVFVRLEHEA